MVTGDGRGSGRVIGGGRVWVVVWRGYNVGGCKLVVGVWVVAEWW